MFLAFAKYFLLQCFSFVGFQKCGFLLAANLLVASLPRLQNKKASTVISYLHSSCWSSRVQKDDTLLMSHLISTILAMLFLRTVN